MCFVPEISKYKRKYNQLLRNSLHNRKRNIVKFGNYCTHYLYIFISRLAFKKYSNLINVKTYFTT